MTIRILRVRIIRHAWLKAESFTEFFSFLGLSGSIPLFPSGLRVRIDLLHEFGNLGDPRPFDKSGYLPHPFAEPRRVTKIFDSFDDSNSKTLTSFSFRVSVPRVVVHSVPLGSLRKPPLR